MKLTLHGSVSASEVVVVEVVVVVVVMLVEVVEVVVVVEQARWEKREGINQEIHAVKKQCLAGALIKPHAHTVTPCRRNGSPKPASVEQHPAAALPVGLEKKRECGSMQDTPAPARENHESE